jgi:hypothetical protein
VAAHVAQQLGWSTVSSISTTRRDLASAGAVPSASPARHAARAMPRRAGSPAAPCRPQPWPGRLMKPGAGMPIRSACSAYLDPYTMSASRMPLPVAITQGDSAGIGPEIIAKAFRDRPAGAAALWRGCGHRPSRCPGGAAWG